jgi:peroxiredoxin
MIHPGKAIPSVPVKLVTAEGIADVTSDEVLGKGRVVLFSVPGAFTPTCHVHHLPSFLANEAKLRAAGVDRIVCATANDHHVVKAWAQASGALGVIDFIADGEAVLAQAMGLTKQMSAMGTRYVRAAMIIEDGIIKASFLEDAPGVNATGAPAILMALEAAKV